MTPERRYLLLAEVKSGQLFVLILSLTVCAIPCCFSLTEDSGEGILDSSTEEITLDETKEGIYLSLDEIGVFLSHLANSGICIFV